MPTTPVVPPVCLVTQFELTSSDDCQVLLHKRQLHNDESAIIWGHSGWSLSQVMLGYRLTSAITVTLIFNLSSQSIFFCDLNEFLSLC